MYLPYKKSTIYDESIPNLSYTALTSNSSIFNSDVQIHSTLELSTSQTCNQSVSGIEYPTFGHSAYFTKNSPKIVATVSETYLPLEPSGSSFSIASNNSRTYPARQEISALSYESFENHFLWNTSLFCSQSRPMNSGLPNNTILDNIFNRNKYDTISADLNNISTNSNDDKNSVNRNYHNKNLSTSFYKTTINDTSCLAIKRNPYSIEEILKKPERKSLCTETINLNHQKNDNQQKNTQLIDVKCSDQTNELSSIHKKGRIRLKIYDMDV